MPVEATIRFRAGLNDDLTCSVESPETNPAPALLQAFFRRKRRRPEERGPD